MKFNSNGKKNILITNKVHEEVIQLLEPHFNLVVNPYSSPLSNETLDVLLPQTDALLAFMTDKVDAAFLQKAPRLQIISAALKGFDNFDLDAIKERQIHFSHIPDLLSQPTAELALTLTLSLLRNLVEGHIHVESGNFKGWRPILYGKTLHNSTVGILGMGAIAKELVRLLKPFNCKISYFDQHRLSSEEEDRLGVHFCDSEQLHKEVDLFYPLISLNPQSYHWLNAKRLSEMRHHTVIINVGRGSLVDEESITQSLVANQIGGYASDVFEMEDWAISCRPKEINPTLLSHPNTVFTPHLGSAVDEIRKQIVLTAANKILAFLKN